MILRVLMSCCMMLMLAEPAFPEKVEDKLNDLADKLTANLDVSEKRTLAILPFESKIGGEENTGQGIAEYLVAVFQGNPSFELVDRIAFNKVLEEIDLSQTEEIDPEHAVQIGKALAAHSLLTGTISNVLGKNMIHARIVETETSKIVSSASVSLNTADLSGFSKELLGEKGQVNSTIFRSLLVPGWGQLYTDNKARGIISFVACIGAGGATIGLGVATGIAHNDYDVHYEYMRTPEMEADANAEVLATGKTYAQVIAEYEQKEANLYKEYTDKYDITVILGIVTGVCWAVNVVDAIIAGAQTKKKVDLYFSGNCKSPEIGLVYRF